jgi:hypothetical protein
MNYIPSDSSATSRLAAHRIRLALRRANYFAAVHQLRLDEPNIAPTVTQLSQDVQDESLPDSPVLPPFPVPRSESTLSSSSSSSSTTTSSTSSTSVSRNLFSATSTSAASTSTSAVENPNQKKTSTSSTSIKSREKMKKKNVSSASKSSDWLSRLPKRIKMTPTKEKIRTDPVPAERLNDVRGNKGLIKEGSLVNKYLKILERDPKRPGKSSWKRAIVFGTVQQKVRRGRWLIFFENKQNLTLKPNEFYLVSEDKNQSVLAKTKTNMMTMKDPKSALIDLTKESIKATLDLTETVDLTQDEDMNDKDDNNNTE